MSSTKAWEKRSNAGSIDFSHWTLVMQGPKANYTLFGDLVR